MIATIPPDVQAKRATRLTGSRFAAALGLNPYETPLECYLSYTEPSYKVNVTPEMEWGLRHEDAIAAAYTDATGVELMKADFLEHPVHDWIGASPDRVPVIQQLSHKKIVELKSGRNSTHWGPDGTDQIPAWYLCQVQIEMDCAGAQVCDVAALLDGNDFRIYTVWHNPRLVAAMVSAGRIFWERVQRREPPPIDWEHPDTPALVSLLYYPDEAEEVTLDLETVAMVDTYRQLGEEESEAHKARERLKAQIIDRMGHAAIGVMPDGQEVRRKVIHKKAYEVAEHDEIRFTVHNRRKGR